MTFWTIQQLDNSQFVNGVNAHDSTTIPIKTAAIVNIASSMMVIIDSKFKPKPSVETSIANLTAIIARMKTNADPKIMNRVIIDSIIMSAPCVYSFCHI